jgi:hypothetical protein
LFDGLSDDEKRRKSFEGRWAKMVHFPEFALSAYEFSG